jgi:hypothetical protein
MLRQKILARFVTLLSVAEFIAGPALAQPLTLGFNNKGEVAYYNHVRDKNGNITTFSIPNYYGTQSNAMNNAGVIAGQTWDTTQSSTEHGFIRQPNGETITFDPPNSVWTEATGINDRGDVVGFFNDRTGTHCYVRNSNGAFTVFDPPPGSPPPVSMVYTINNDGYIAGVFGMNPSPEGHFDYLGFLRDPQGGFTIFDDTMGFQSCASNQGDCVGVMNTDINNRGDIVGSFWDSISPSGYRARGFIREPHGAITLIDAPNSGYGGGPNPGAGHIVTDGLRYSINDAKEVSGYFWDELQNRWRSFIRAKDGEFTVFDAPNAMATYATRISDNGDVAGSMQDLSWEWHIFVRERNGNFSVFYNWP